MKIKDILLFPFRLLFLLLKTISRFILKNEINDERQKNAKIFSALHEKLNVFKKENEKISTENIKFEARFSRFKEIVENSINDTFELAITRKNEFVIISYTNCNIFDSIKLFGENGKNKFWDSKIEFIKRGEEIHIADFQSKIEGKGYGRVLMDFTIKKALEKKFTSITGKLSSVDSKNFNFLIPFYKSFGFDCTLYKVDEKMIVGKIELNLKKESVL